MPSALNLATYSVPLSSRLALVGRLVALNSALGHELVDAARRAVVAHVERDVDCCASIM